ncbi:MAG: ATP-dependent DNA helicase [Verrucomicrobiia bacterium]
MAVKIDLAKKKISLGVGDLVAEPMSGAGRVAGLRMWTRLALGREAHVKHQRAQAELHEGYAQEIFVRYTTVVDEFKVTVQGRIDGVYRPLVKGNGHGGQWVIEEIKSVVLPPLVFAVLDANSHPHYVEQLRLYCFFVENDRGSAGVSPAMAEDDRDRDGRATKGNGGAKNGHRRDACATRVIGRLVYVNVADGSRKDIDIHGPFDDCEKMIAERVRTLIGNAYEEERRRDSRRKRATEVHFPYDKPRKYQDRMIAAVEKALAEGRHLMVSAPSGIGKTAAALYPAVKYALANDMRLFFVTAKNTQQAIAVETLRKMGNSPHPVPLPSTRGEGVRRMGDGPESSNAVDGRDARATITAVFFRAREQMCINDVYACHEEFCQHLRDFTAKLALTRIVERLLGQRLVMPEGMIEAGRQARFCPFELALLEAELTDVIVCDYNYVFDPQVYFRRFFQDADYSDTLLIIDEAHNLLQRAMDYYSPSLRRQQIRELMGDLKHVEPALAQELKQFLKELDRFFAGVASQRADADQFLIDCPRPFFDELKPMFNRLTVRYLLDKISRGRAIPDDPVEEFFSDFGQFCVVLAMEADEFSYVFDATQGQSIKIVCKDPSRQLAERIEGFHSVIAMSATLAPMGFYRQMLGFDADRTDQVTLPSPFPRENRKIIVVPQVSTTFRQRSANYGRIADIIATTVWARRGNYMALFPSYEFMRAVAEKLPFPQPVTLSPSAPLRVNSAKGLSPLAAATEICRRTTDGPQRFRSAQNDNQSGYRVLIQTPNMTEVQRQQFVESLKQPDPPKLVLAVQGGLFAEGVDYPGDLLSGVVVVSPALPQVSFERELMRQYYEDRYGKGFEFAYLYPGMNRVIQSVGRLIRTETDRGVAVLVCQRFAQPQYSTLFPPDWSDEAEGGLAHVDLADELQRFWSRIEGRRRD